MPPVITDPTAFATVKQLNDEVEAARVAAFAARDYLEEVANRRIELRQLLADHNAAEPAPEPDVTAELGELLASNPAAAMSADWTAKLRESQDATAQAVKAWQGKRTIIDQALARIESEMSARTVDFDAAKALHERAWVAFVNTARVAMTDELEHQFAEFYAQVLGPLDALNNARKLYANEPVYSGARRQVSAESRFIIGTPPITFGPRSDGVQLYPSEDGPALAAMLDTFRQRLTETGGAPAPRAKAQRG